MSVAFSFVKNRQFAEEVVQDAFIKVAERARSFRPNTNGYSWIIKIVQNLSLNKLKYIKRRRAYDVDALHWLSDENETANKSEAGLALRDAIKKLDEDERRLIVLKYYYDKTVREISSITGQSKSAVQRAVDSAERKLKDFLE